MIKLSYFIISAILLLAFEIPNLNAQSGFAKTIPINANVNFDDIIFHDDQLILRGNIGIDSLGLWGLLIVGLDTNGVLLWQSVIHDTTLESHIILNTPSRFLVTTDKRLILPVKFHQTHQLAIYFTGLDGREEMHRFYEINEGLLFPFDVNEIENDFYISGVISSPGGDMSVFVLKVKPNGEKAWIKYFGLANQFEVSYDAIVNPDQTLTIYADQADRDFVYSEQKEGWKKPWVFTIDTSGAIVSEWLGEENDPRTLGGGFFKRMANGDWIMQSMHYKNVPNDFGMEVRVSPTVTRLDSNFSQIWKVYLSNYEKRSDQIQDLEVDNTEQAIVVTGGKHELFENESEFVNWTVKINTEGQILWNNTDSVYYSRQNTHNTAGLDIAPSGSIYVGGYVTINELEPGSQGFVIKYTADGCSDTICTTTSIEEQIRNCEKNVILYPNPVKDELNISIKELNRIGNLKIFDVQGKELLVTKVIKGMNAIPIHKLSNGIYFYTIYDPISVVSSGKFIVQN